MFAPLRIISGYSFLQSGLTIEKIADSVNKKGYFGAGLSDNGVLYGVPSFVKELTKLNKGYLIGLETFYEDNYLILYAYSETGYHNLIKLSLLINKGEFNYQELEKNHLGLIGILETNYGKFASEFSSEPSPEFLKYYAKLSTCVDKFYLGLEITSKKEFARANEIREFARDHSYETIAFPRIRYQNKGDKLILTIVNAIDKDERIETKEENGEQYFRDLEFYSKLYTKSEINLTEELIKSSSFNFNQKRGSIIHYPVNDSIRKLKEDVYNGLKTKGIDDEEHIARAKYELSTIIEMGYADYFLIVADYVNYAKNHDILVGPGRGSAAGSLVSYALGITEVDPLKFDLQFERFLNKARKSMPDIDIDFMDTKRDEMIQYMRDRYGNEHVASIVAFQTIQAKQALRDIGRIYNIPTRHIDLLCKSITDKVTLREAYKKIATFKSLVDSDKYFLDIVSLASKIEGLPRQAGLHAAGLLLNEVELKDSLPVTVDLDDRYTSQFEKEFLEEQGFLKMDFLSLRNLTAIDYCLNLIKENTGRDISFYEIPYDDKETFEVIRKGQTIGVFQLESSGMRNAIKIIKPSEFEDIVTLLAIFRPGPMDNIKDYADRKSGKIKVTYLSEELKRILAPTYGVLIYQEQVNKIAQVMAGFSPEDADLFRRAISHKDKAVLESSKSSFISGSVNKGYSLKDATLMFNTILKFADYGFNRSHAVVYAIIACRMAYLKHYYPLEFYTSILTISSGKADHKFSDYVSEIKARNYKVNLPNINKSGKDFVIYDNGLLFPLTMIKGMTEVVVNKVIDERLENGEYTDFFNFVSRAFNKGIGETFISKFIDSGSLDSLYSSRASMRTTLRYAYQLAELSYDKNGQLILDATLDSQKQFFKDVDIPLVNLNLEYESLGIMISDNPLKYKKDLLDMNHAVPLNEAKDKKGIIHIAGIISDIKIIKVRKTGKNMAFLKIFDDTDEIEVTVFTRVYEESFKLLNKNNIVLIKGKYDEKDGKESFVADEITLLE